MSSVKILFKISGSIAAYKCAAIISKLVQSGFEVQTVATEAALRFIGPATLEGLTGKPVLTQLFEPGQMMNHIHLVKWADMTILAPATANTINRLAHGLADNLVGALFLAHDRNKPYLLVPAMNTNMYHHPATKLSLEKLQNWGVTVLPTNQGYLACGDEGPGKMLEPEAVITYIMEALEAIRSSSDQSRQILITAGGTQENIDSVRFLSNISTGHTGASLADSFIRRGVHVTYLHGMMALKPTLPCYFQSFESSSDLEAKLKQLLSKKRFDAVIHLAAVSDYIPGTLLVEKQTMPLPMNEKLTSNPKRISITLKRNPKIIKKIKSFSKNKQIKLIAFKMTAQSSADQQRQAALNLLEETHSDMVVGNDIADRKENCQYIFQIYKRSSKSHHQSALTVDNLGEILNKELFETKD
ncbi:MAG: bifunctional phosphopantothenoylcysteine decarboxylase/phosphopantothenate--cysteine ligase CoaBC [Candidatus Marinimicrobia bacterium]|nr:bifunctional phosphopantothenoylcysteine decarboxylase/phosphopantothenate--cysteine ligase CoaBC [Candidatus Neomarinimicrobiota bacterium]